MNELLDVGLRRSCDNSEYDREQRNGRGLPADTRLARNSDVWPSEKPDRDMKRGRADIEGDRQEPIVVRQQFFDEVDREGATKTN